MRWTNSHKKEAEAERKEMVYMSICSFMVKICKNCIYEHRMNASHENGEGHKVYVPQLKLLMSARDELQAT